MKFALFYEIPVANPEQPNAEYRAYQNTLEQAVFGEKMGFHAFWTVEHHFLKHFSHCSNPEVLYGAIEQTDRGSNIVRAKQPGLTHRRMVDSARKS